MDLQLAGKRALILGGASGLGLGVAAALASEGCRVVLMSRNAGKLEQAALAIGASAMAVAADLNDWPTVKAAVAKAQDALAGSFDILVNNSGGPPTGPISGVADDVWRSHFEMMVLGYVRNTDLLLPAMRANGWGRIINIASSSVVEPIADLGLSNSLRASVVGWAKTLANEVGRDGVTVNTLLPGRIDTKRTKGLDESRARTSGETVAAVRDRINAGIPVGRPGTPEEFGAVAAFLASPLASYITGGTIRVDGGALRSV